MIFRAKTACGDEDDSLSYLGLRSDFYVSKPVPTSWHTSGKRKP
jgi:hypothetical protein